MTQVRTRVRLGRVLWIGAAAILVVAAAVALAAVLRGGFSETDGRILVTLAALLYAGGTALSGLALIERGRAPLLAWAAVVAAPIALALMLWGIWSFVLDGEGDDPDRAAWSATLGLLAGLVATTALLLARSRLPLLLAACASALAALAAGLSIGGIWAEPESDAYVQLIASLWILAILAFFLVPVLQRFASAAEPAQVRTLGELDGVELVASRAPIEGGVPVEPPLRGERLALRRR
ncbi:MAG: hypothetical protein RMM28_08080 [Thermoleophilia bacterium]|nr:hypothetical protein [Gaiellaceae bacterium]MDW8339079.1 hypothetical protein [Thermoleophilia bacterium]